MVYRTKKLQKTTFRNLPFGAQFWITPGTNTPPYVKMGREGVVDGFDSEHLTVATVNDLSVRVTKLPKAPLQFSGSNL